MRKVIAAINMTLDGFCDHTAIPADEETHQHYAELLKAADAIVFGRITYQLMEYWQTVPENPTGEKSTDAFAAAIDDIQKIVFSNTLKSVGWKTTRLATRSIKEEIEDLKQSGDSGSRDILIGSPGLIVSLTNLGLIDEYQLCVYPVVEGSGLPLFNDIHTRINLKLLNTKAFNCGAVVLYYTPVN